MRNPEALFGVVPFGRVDFRPAGLGGAWHGVAWPERGMESGEDWRGSARRGGAWHGKEYGEARRGAARLGPARQGMEHGRAHPQEQQTNTTQWKQHTQTH